MPDPLPRKPTNIYGGIPDTGPESFDGHLLDFAEDLRSEGLAGRTPALFEALQHIPWTDQTDFKETLAATLAKSPEDRRVYELVFDRFFFRAAEAEAARRDIAE